MSKVSIRQPLVLYAMVFVFLVAVLAVTIASFALVRASRRAYHRATTKELGALVSQRSTEAIRHLVDSRGLDADLEMGLVTAGSPALGVDLAGARSMALRNNPDPNLIAVRVVAPGEEAYVVARIDPSIPMSIAFVEVSRMVPLVLIGAIAIAAVLAFMIGRLLLPSLDLLSEIAAATTVEQTTDLEPSETPNEILEVAHRFRRTVRRLNEDRARIEAQKDDLARMQEGLIRASKLASVGRLAAGVAHEIGNPLAAVRGYLSLLSSGLSPEQEKDVLTRSIKELGRINDTIRKLLTYARQGEEPNEPLATLSTSAVIAEAMALVTGHPALRGVSFDVTADAGEGDTEPAHDGLGHAGRLNQVLVNLLLNAGQAFADDAQDRRITIETSSVEDTEYIEITVADNGPGIPAEQIPHVFDPFFTTKAPGEGTGLGLAVSRALMEAMGGDLVLDVEHTGGARFVIRLSRAPSRDGAPDGDVA